MRTTWLLGALFGSLVACKKPPAPSPPPDRNALSSCTIEEASATSGQLHVGRISMMSVDSAPLKLAGRLIVDVVLKKDAEDPAPKRICGGATALDASSYAAFDQAKATIALDGTCTP